MDWAERQWLKLARRLGRPFKQETKVQTQEANADSLLKQAQEGAVARFGNQAEVRFRSDRAKSQWWVRSPDGKEVLAADTIGALVQALTSTQEKPTINGVDEMNTTQTAAMLGEPHPAASAEAAHPPTAHCPSVSAPDLRRSARAADR